MSTNRLKVLLVSLLAAFAISAIASASASAACYRVAPAGATTGNKDSTCSSNTKVTKNEYINGTKVTLLKQGEWCAKVETAGTGQFSDNKCEVTTGAKEFIKVFAAEEPYTFFKGGVGIATKKFTGTQVGSSILRATGLVITCTSGSSTGTFAGNTSKVEEVEVKFHECTSSGTCEVHSKNVPVGGDRDSDSDEIITGKIQGTLGETTVGALESNVGIDLEPEGSTTFVELEGQPANCIPPTKIKGSVIGAVTPVNVSQKTGTLKFAENAGGTEQLIQSIEEEGSEGNADPAKDVLTGFIGQNRLTNETTIELTTKEAFEVHNPSVEEK